MKILFVDGTDGHNPIDPYEQPQGGILTSLTRVPEYLASKGHEVWVKSSFGKTLDVRGVHYIDGTTTIPKWDITVFNRNLLDTQFVDYCKENGIKCLWWLHDMVDTRYFMDDTFKKMDHAVALSEYCKESYAEFYNLKRECFTVIPNGVDKSVFYPGKYEERNPKLFVMASALIKGYAPIQLTYQTLVRVLGKPELRIYSNQSLHGYKNSPDQEKFLEVMAGEGASIRHPIPQKILADVLRQAWVLLMPNSYPEMCSNLLLQAQACGTPVVASNISSIPEFIKHGDTGILTKHYPHDIFLWGKAYAKATVDLARNKQMHHHISETAPKSVKSWEDVGEMWHELVSKLVA